MVRVSELICRIVYKRNFFRNVASENSREALGVRNAFSYVDIGRLKGSNQKAIINI